MNPGAYLQRIGYTGPRAPTLALLETLVQRHTAAIAFENLDAFLGRRPSLDPADLELKLVQKGCGGWCFEHNGLFGDVLRALGFEVTDLAARVLWNRPADALTPRTHRLLRVRAEGGDWLVDVGFGGHTLTGVLDFHSDVAQPTSHEPFRLRRLDGDERVLESLIAGEWKPLCRFDPHPQLPIDFEAANFQLAHDPGSHFTQRLVVSRVVPEGRHVLAGRELVFHALRGDTTRRELPVASEVPAILEGLFGLNLETVPVAALVARLQPGSASA